MFQLTCGQHKIRFYHINSVTTEPLEVWNAPRVVETTDMDVGHLHREISRLGKQFIMSFMQASVQLTVNVGNLTHQTCLFIEQVSLAYQRRHLLCVSQYTAEGFMFYHPNYNIRALSTLYQSDMLFVSRMSHIQQIKNANGLSLSLSII